MDHERIDRLGTEKQVESSTRDYQLKRVGEWGQANACTRTPTVSEAILMREIKLQSELEAIKELRRNLSINILEGPITAFDPIFQLKPSV